MRPASTRRLQPVRPDPRVVPPLAAAAHLHLWSSR
jgi:hypothetical protein